MIKYRTNADDYTSSDAAKFGISFPVHEGMTQPEFASDCDINTIISRYESLQVPMPIADPSQFGDFTGLSDYHTICNRIASIDQHFEDLPATVRKRFDNDPGQLLAFLDDPTSRSEAEQLGLIQKSTTAPVVNAPAAGEGGKGVGTAHPQGGGQPATSEHILT